MNECFHHTINTLDYDDDDDNVDNTSKKKRMSRKFLKKNSIRISIYSSSLVDWIDLIFIIIIIHLPTGWMMMKSENKILGSYLWMNEKKNDGQKWSKLNEQCIHIQQEKVPNEWTKLNWMKL